MIISSEHKFVFVHVPKTAGRSIAFALERYRNPNLIKPWQADKHPGMHSSVREIKRRFPFCNDFFFFGFCRNPYDRMVSWYYGLRNHSPSQYGKLDFDTFVQVVVGEGRLRQLRPQVTYLEDLGNRGDIKSIGRFENLEEDCARFFKRIGLPSISIPHKGMTEHKHWSSYYDNPETRKLVEVKFSEDFYTFKYGKLE